MIQVKRGRGRPKLENPKGRLFNFKVTPDEYIRLFELAENVNATTATALVRELISDGLIHRAYGVQNKHTKAYKRFYEQIWEPHKALKEDLEKDLLKSRQKKG